MLRRAPTSISLSHRDVREHLEHINLQKLRERENIQPGQGRRLAPVQGGCVPMTLSREHLDSNEKNNVTVYESDKTNQQRGSQGNVTFASYPPDGAEGRAHGDSLLSGAKADLIATEKLPASVICNNSEVDDNIIPADLSDSLEHLEEPRVLRHEDSSVQPQTSKPRTDYGGLAEGFSGQSSLLVPQDMSTPRNYEMSDVHRVRYRVPLPRSPLYRSQGANSPEGRPTVSLISRVASQGTAGMLLSQPARRPRSYRRRTISYSFEESDRASTAFEQPQGSDNDSIGSQPPAESMRSLRGEFEGRSLQSAASDSNVPSSASEFARRARATQPIMESQASYLSSFQLPLPPPFSSIPRNVSSAASGPLGPRGEPQLRSPSPNSRSRPDMPRLPASPVTSSPTSSREEEESSLGSSGILRSLATLPLRLFSVYHSRSPPQSRFDALDSRLLSPSSRGSREHSPEDPPSTSARRQFHIYDDSMPASIQPQTPQHLPEARHQSRFHPSYTAPTDSQGHSRPHMNRRRRARSNSPAGMEMPGFQGLYGGQENADDEVSFDRAAQRLWTLGSPRRHGWQVDEEDAG